MNAPALSDDAADPALEGSGGALGDAFGGALPSNYVPLGDASCGTTYKSQCMFWVQRFRYRLPRWPRPLGRIARRDQPADVPPAMTPPTRPAPRCASGYPRAAPHLRGVGSSRETLRLADRSEDAAPHGAAGVGSRLVFLGGASFCEGSLSTGLDLGGAPLACPDHVPIADPVVGLAREGPVSD
jgi:hypothetical protein